MSKDRDRAFFGHPAGLSTLFFTEMWERFSYYGMRALLIYYMTKPVNVGALGMSKETGGIVWGMFVASAYLLSLPGGWIADRFIGQRKAIVIGGLGILAGNVLLAIPMPELFFPGLVTIALGTGLLKPNVSTVVGQLYAKEDPRRDSGYTIFYMGINIGALAAPIACGYLGQNEGFRSFMHSHGLDPNWAWHVAFAASAIGMAFGLVQFVVGFKRMGEAGARPTIPTEPAKIRRDRVVLAVILGVLTVLSVVVVIVEPGKELLADIFGVGLLIAAIILFIGFYKLARDHEERRRVLAMIPLFVGCVAFFAIFEQAGTTLSLFADDVVRRNWLGFDFLPAYYQDVNPIFIIVLAPVFAWMWIKLVKAKKEPSSVIKFAIGMVLVAVSFIVMLPTISSVSTIATYAPVGHLPMMHDTVESTIGPLRVSPNYLIALYFFSTCAELCISPVGLSSMNKLAPQRLAGMVMGTWFLGTSIGEYLAGRAAGFTAAHGYGFLFYTLIIASFVVAAALFAVAPIIRRMMSGRAAPLPTAVAVEPNAEAPPAAS